MHLFHFWNTCFSSLSKMNITQMRSYFYDSFIAWEIVRVRLHVNKSDLWWGFSRLLAFPGFGSSLWHSSRGLLWIARSFNALWRIFCLSVFPHGPGFNNTLCSHRARMCSPDAHRGTLPGGVKENLKTNGGASINTWSQDGKEAFPGLTSWCSITSQFTTTFEDAPTAHF